jgi:CxC5 like cysteine cluster associated with KDZ transposases
MAFSPPGTFTSCVNVCAAFRISLTQLLISDIDCLTSYRNNYSVNNGSRTYYPGIPKYLEVGQHQFVDSELAHMWVMMMLVGW